MKIKSSLIPVNNDLFCKLQNKEQTNDIYMCTCIQFIQNYKNHTNENAAHVLTCLPFPFLAYPCSVYTLQNTKYW